MGRVDGGWVVVVSGIMIQALLFGSSVLSLSEYIPRGRGDGVGGGGVSGVM